MEMWYDDGHMDGGWGIVMAMAMMGVVVALVAAGVVIAVVAATRSTRAPSGGNVLEPTAGAEQILAERLARGEIDTEEYQARLHAMRARPRGA